MFVCLTYTRFLASWFASVCLVTIPWPTAAGLCGVQSAAHCWWPHHVEALHRAKWCCILSSSLQATAPNYRSAQVSCDSVFSCNLLSCLASLIFFFFVFRLIANISDMILAITYSTFYPFVVTFKCKYLFDILLTPMSFMTESLLVFCVFIMPSPAVTVKYMVFLVAK